MCRHSDVKKDGPDVPDVIVHFFVRGRPFTNAKSSDSDTHEWINEIFCCSFSRMPRHLIVTCMNLSIASMLDKSSFFGLGDPRIGSHQVVGDPRVGSHEVVLQGLPRGPSPSVPPIGAVRIKTVEPPGIHGLVF